MIIKDVRHWTKKQELTDKEKKEIQKKNEEQENANKDIITTEYVEVIEYQDNKKIITLEEKKTNITKQINETAKILKIENQQKILNLLNSLNKETN